MNLSTLNAVVFFYSHQKLCIRTGNGLKETGVPLLLAVYVISDCGLPECPPTGVQYEVTIDVDWKVALNWKWEKTEHFPMKLLRLIISKFQGNCQAMSRLNLFNKVPFLFFVVDVTYSLLYHPLFLDFTPTFPLSESQLVFCPIPALH